MPIFGLYFGRISNLVMARSFWITKLGENNKKAHVNEVREVYMTINWNIIESF